MFYAVVSARFQPEPGRTILPMHKVGSRQCFSIQLDGRFQGCVRPALNGVTRGHQVNDEEDWKLNRRNFGPRRIPNDIVIDFPFAAGQ